MNTSNFFDTGQRNKFPDFSEFDTFSEGDETEFDVIRHIQFFAKGEVVKLKKLKEFFTEKAIRLYEHDGYLNKKKDER